MSDNTLTPLQIEVARLFFALPASAGYTVAGGAALVASHLIDRPTDDLDLFTHGLGTTVAPARDGLLAAARARGWQVTVIHDDATFCRIVIDAGHDQLLVDLAVDSPPNGPATMTILGPTLDPLDLAARKLLALFGRAEARDFADVYALAREFGTHTLLTRAAEEDAGFTKQILAQMIHRLDRFTDDEIPIHPSQVSQLRAFFADWARQLATPARPEPSHRTTPPRPTPRQDRADPGIGF